MWSHIASALRQREATEKERGRWLYREAQADRCSFRFRPLYKALVRNEVRFRVGSMVFAAFYDDDTIMGFTFPRDLREGLVALGPDKFLMPRPSDMRFNWVLVRLDAIDIDELRDLLVEEWRMCVPKKVADAYESGTDH